MRISSSGESQHVDVALTQAFVVLSQVRSGVEGEMTVGGLVSVHRTSPAGPVGEPQRHSGIYVQIAEQHVRAGIAQVTAVAHLVIDGVAEPVSVVDAVAYGPGGDDVGRR